MKEFLASAIVASVVAFFSTAQTAKVPTVELKGYVLREDRTFLFDTADKKLLLTESMTSHSSRDYYLAFADRTIYLEAEKFIGQPAALTAVKVERRYETWYLVTAVEGVE